jgi:hypothetical protein
MVGQMEADPTVMALCRELREVTVLVFVRRAWGWWVAFGQLECADRCVLPAVTGQTVGNRRAVCSQGRAIRSVEVRVIKGIKWNESGMLK